MQWSQYSGYIVYKKLYKRFSYDSYVDQNAAW